MLEELAGKNLVKTIDTTIGNYYGTLEVCEWSDGTYTVELENWSGNTQKPISKELAQMMIKELT